jgi:hypothetical protein
MRRGLARRTQPLRDPALAEARRRRHRLVRHRHANEDLTPIVLPAPPEALRNAMPAGSGALSPGTDLGDTTVECAMRDGALAKGAISGKVLRGGDDDSAMRVCAFELAEGMPICTQTARGQRAYKLELQRGDYLVLAIPATSTTRAWVTASAMRLSSARAATAGTRRHAVLARIEGRHRARGRNHDRRGPRRPARTRGSRRLAATATGGVKPADSRCQQPTRTLSAFPAWSAAVIVDLPEVEEREVALPAPRIETTARPSSNCGSTRSTPASAMC